jgi:amidophosphoribosyltransferase
MCGITGLMLTIHEHDPQTKIESVKNVFRFLLKKTQTRGPEATGVAILNKGGQIYFTKNAMSADEFVTTQQYADVMDKVSRQTIGIIGHCRLPTQGDVWFNCNNHPLMFGSTLGIHNGVITNDSALKTKFKLKLRGQCDSEVIFALYNFAREKLKFPADKALKFLKQQVKGSYACAIFSKWDPDNLILFRNWNPIYLTRTVPKNPDGFASVIFNSDVETINSMYKDYDDSLKRDAYLHLGQNAGFIIDPSLTAEEIEFGDAGERACCGLY